MSTPNSAQVLLLCGGRGIRPRNCLDYIPKGMVKIGNRPLIWHVMKGFALFGFSRFVLALGENGNMIRDYFIDYTRYTDDFKMTLGLPQLEVLTRSQEASLEITFAETGASAGTGARVSRCQKYIQGDQFLVAYSDCLSNVNIMRLWEYHTSRGKIATITGVRPPFRYGEFVVEGERVTLYHEKSLLVGSHGWINGGFMVFNRGIFGYLTSFNECTLEREVFGQLVNDQQLAIYQHPGYWQYIDTDREIEEVRHHCETNRQPWLEESET